MLIACVEVLNQPNQNRRFKWAGCHPIFVNIISICENFKLCWFEFYKANNIHI